MIMALGIYANTHARSLSVVARSTNCDGLGIYPRGTKYTQSLHQFEDLLCVQSSKTTQTDGLSIQLNGKGLPKPSHMGAEAFNPVEKP